MKRSDIEREEARQSLLKLLKPGQTVYTILRHVSASGMFRVIDLAVITRGDEKAPLSIGWTAAQAMGDKHDRDRQGIRISGCGMDMGFALVYNLGATLWPQGTKKPHGTRNGEPDHEGGYALKHRWL